MKRTSFLTFILWLTLGCSTPLYSQFRYIGADGQIIGGSHGGTQFATSVGYLNQFSAHHGFGVDVVFSRLLIADLGRQITFPQYDRRYDCDLVWTRRLLPAIAARYRLFIGNEFFIGSNLQLGLIKERFFADRLGDYNDGFNPVDPVYMDYTLLTPYFRLSFETGLLFDMGSVLYGTFQARVGAQQTISRVPLFGSFLIDQNDFEHFKPYQGTEAMGGIVLGMGVKL